MGLWDRLTDPKNRKKVAWAAASTGLISAATALVVDNYGLNPLEWRASGFSWDNVKAAGIKAITSPFYRYAAVAYIESIAKSPVVDYVAKGLERIVEADMGKVACSSVLFGLSLGYKLAEYALLREAGAENPEHLLTYSLVWAGATAVAGAMMRDERSIPQQIKDGTTRAGRGIEDFLVRYGAGIKSMPGAEVPALEAARPETENRYREK